MARDFRCRGSILRRIRCPFESPGVPSSPLEPTAVLETFWRQSPSGYLDRDAWGFPIC
jgi:hypothetical protein